MNAKKSTGRPILPQALCAFALCFTLLIFAPVEMVTINSTNFWFGVTDFLPAFVGLFLAALAAVQVVFLLLRRAPYAVWLLMLSLLFSVTVMVYVQGTYLCLGSEALTSGDPVWREMLGEMAVNLAVWAAVMLGSAVLSLVRPKFFLRLMPAAAALILVMEGAALVSLLTGGSLRGDLSRVYCSDEDQFTYSANGDVVMIMLDTFDTRFMDKALEEEQAYAAAFEDFTYYRNASSSTMLTDTSFMSFMTGVTADNSEPFFHYCRRAMRGSGFLPAMKDAGMTVQLYAPPYGALCEEQLELVDNLHVRESYIASQAGFAKDMLLMVGYRYFPTALQPFVLRDYVGGFNRQQRMRGVEHGESTSSNPAFIAALNERGVTRDDSRRFFKFHLLHGAHKPTQMNRLMQEDTSGQVSQYEQALGCFAMLDALFEQMKAQGVYDSATIIVFGDHGVNDDWRNGISNPAVLVKYPGEQGPMRTSMAPTSLLDLRATALYGAGLDHEAEGTPIHAWEGTKERERTMLAYTYDVPYSYTFYLDDMTEYAVPQDATDLDAYAPTGRVFRKGGADQ